MNRKSFTGATLEKALKEGALGQSGAVLIGMVKPSEKAECIGFSRHDCETWVDLPTSMIEHAEHIGQHACRDHSHPTMKINLREPKDSEGKTLLALLAQAAPDASAELSLGGSLRAPQFRGGDFPAQTFLGTQWDVFDPGATPGLPKLRICCIPTPRGRRCWTCWDRVERDEVFTL